MECHLKTKRNRSKMKDIALVDKSLIITLFIYFLVYFFPLESYCKDHP